VRNLKIWEKTNAKEQQLEQQKHAGSDDEVLSSFLVCCLQAFMGSRNQHQD